MAILVLATASASAQKAPDTGRITAAVPAGGQIAFRVARENVDIGTHTLVFRVDGEQVLVDIAIEFRVTAFGATIYLYHHHSTEIWRDNRLVSLKSEANVNGIKFDVIATVDETGINVEARGVRTVLPKTFLPSSYWNPAWLQAEGLLNTETGDATHVKMTGPVAENIATEHGRRETVRYTITSPHHAEIWFDRDGQWVKSRFVGPDGSTINYILQ